MGVDEGQVAVGADRSAGASGKSTPGLPQSVAASPQWAIPPKKPEGFSPFVAFCFTINYILGTGFLTIPWAYVQGGLALSTALMVIVCVFADMAKDYILETIARAEAMLDERMRWLSPGDAERGPPLVYSPLIPRPGKGNIGSRDDMGNVELEAMSTTAVNVDYSSIRVNARLDAGGGKTASNLTRQNSLPKYLPNSQPRSMPGTPGSSQHGTSTPGSSRRALIGRHLVQMEAPKYMVKHRKFEINALCRVFLGRFGKNVYMLFLSLYVYCTLWAYTSVFASAMAREFPFGWDEDFAYFLYAIVFGVIVIPMSCLELDEQVTVQVFLTGCRFLMVFLMVGTSAMCAQENNFSGIVSNEPVPMFRPKGLHKTLPIIVFATIYHHSIPGLAHPVANKKKLSPIFISTTAFCGLAYSFIGFVLGSSFGDRINESSNLNWGSFRGGTGVLDDEGNFVGVAWWARLISLYIICFPAIDVLSAFPLNAITLGNNLLSAFYGRRIHEVENNRRVRIQFRLLAAIPPIILAILVRELGTITDYAGTTGFVLTFSFPALLYIQSRRLAQTKSFSTETYYSSYASSYTLASVLFFFGFGMLIFVVTLQIME